MSFGQLVIGPPGSGKTTYCRGVAEYLNQVGVNAAIVNLDPANESLEGVCAADIRELVSLERVQETHGLGPNGGLVFCLEYLAANVDWLEDKIRTFKSEDCYLLFDLPGQVELWSNHGALRDVVDRLARNCGLRLCTVNLVDSLLCSDAPKFVSALLLSLSSMLHIELPHVNVLSKADLAQRIHGDEFRLTDFLDCCDLPSLADRLDAGAFSHRYRTLTAAICETVEDYALVDFLPLSIEDPKSVGKVLDVVHQANGFCFKPLTHDPYAAAQGGLCQKQTPGVRAEGH